MSLATNPAPAKPDLVKPAAMDRVEIRFEAPCEIEEKIASLKGLLAHKYPALSLGELVNMLCELGLREWNPARSRKRQTIKVDEPLSDSMGMDSR